MSPDDKLATYGIDDPVVEGVACHFTVPEKGGLSGMFGVAEEVSDISLACRQVGPIKIKEVEASQQQIIAIVRQLESEGAVSLKGTVGEQYVV